MTHEQTQKLMVRALGAFWQQLERDQPQTMYHAVDEDAFYNLEDAAFKAINIRLTGSRKG